MNELYSRYLGSQRLAARVQSPAFDNSQEDKHVPYLDVVVSRRLTVVSCALGKIAYGSLAANSQVKKVVA